MNDRKYRRTLNKNLKNLNSKGYTKLADGTIVVAGGAVIGVLKASEEKFEESKKISYIRNLQHTKIAVSDNTEIDTIKSEFSKRGFNPTDNKFIKLWM